MRPPPPARTTHILPAITMRRGGGHPPAREDDRNRGVKTETAQGGTHAEIDPVGSPRRGDRGRARRCRHSETCPRQNIFHATSWTAIPRLSRAAHELGGIPC